MSSIILHEKGTEFFLAYNKVNKLIEKVTIASSKYTILTKFIEDFDPDFIQVRFIL